ncbi:MAG: bifunctional riboflavin kinase/FAD synthetase [Saccharofermentanales bacterium]
MLNKDISRGIGLGVFDGCHIGHAELILALVSKSAYLDLVPAVYTFRNHPSYVTGDTGRISDGILTDDAERDRLLKEKGVADVIYQDFTETFSSLEPEEFLNDYIATGCNAKLVVVGYNFRFGRDRKGDVQMLSEWGMHNGIEIIIVKPVMYRGEPVSSSAIRKLIRTGDLRYANGMLGRSYRLSGEVIQGQRLGTKLGFPTANFYPADNMCLPANGVYVTRLFVNGKCYDSVTNIGNRPSVPGRTEQPVVETMILEGDIDLYGRKIDVEFMCKLRDEMQFESLDLLKDSVSKDVARATEYHADSEDIRVLGIRDNIKLSGIHSRRFATNILSISITLPADKERVSEYKLLSRVLTATSGKYPSRNLLINKMNSLYGAVINCSTSKSGDALTIEFTADALHCWDDDTYSFKDAADLLFDMISFPDLDENDCFKEEIVEAEKKGLISEIRSRENDKLKYSLDKAMAEYAGDSVFAVRAFGDVSVLEGLDGERLKRAYDRMLTSGYVYAGIAGRYDRQISDHVLDRLADIFRANEPERRIVPGVFPGYFYRTADPADKSEIRDVEQTKICLVLENTVGNVSYRNMGITLMNEILGGDVDSLLFRTVREELGLAYSVFSFSVPQMNALIMLAGVAGENSETAVTAMKEQLSRIRRGDYDDSILISAKISLRSMLVQSSDNLRDMMNNWSASEMRGSYTRVEDLIDEIERIGKDDLCRIAAWYKPAVSFIVTGKTRKSRIKQQG